MAQSETHIILFCKQFLFNNRLKTMVIKFRFQNLQIWQFAIEICDDPLDIADDLAERNSIDSQNS